MRFKLYGIDFECSFLVVAVMSAVLILDTTFRICACFISALIHECGHLFAMGICHIKPNRIALRAFDIAIDENSSKSFLCDMFITVMGPVFNLIFAVVFLPFSKLMVISNLFIGLFNLLPVDTFDGGHALKILLLRKCSFTTVDKVLKLLTFAFLVPFLFCGVMMLFYSKYNYSLLLISLYLIAILFIK